LSLLRFFPTFFAFREDNSPISLEKAERRFTTLFKHAADTTAATPISESCTIDINNRQSLRKL